MTTIKPIITSNKLLPYSEAFGAKGGPTIFRVKTRLTVVFDFISHFIDPEFQGGVPRVDRNGLRPVIGLRGLVVIIDGDITIDVFDNGWWHLKSSKKSVDVIFVSFLCFHWKPVVLSLWLLCESKQAARRESGCLLDRRHITSMPAPTPRADHLGFVSW